MKEISIEESKQIQMEIMEAIDKFCVENGIKYSIAGGTMLGAVRHQGFIPWDDDIDIYMLRSDYNLFEKLFPNLYMGKYSLVSLHRSNKWHRVCGKVYDIRTRVLNLSRNTADYGVNVDVFPVDEVPDNEGKWQSFNKRRRTLVRLTAIKAWNFRYEGSISKFILKSIIKIPLFLVNKKQLLLYVERYIQQYNGKGSKWIYECGYGFTNRHPFLRSTFDDIIEWPFENRTLKGFKNADNYLRNAYGDYMQLPPEDKRIGHSDPAFWLDE